MRLFKFFSAVIIVMLLVANDARAEEDVLPSANQQFMLTIFLKHDQSKSLDQLQAELEETGFWAEFPPEGIEIVSWYVMMGVGQVVTLSLPPERLREVNLAIEKTAWGPFRTEFYPTYDLSPIAAELRLKAQSSQSR